MLGESGYTVEPAAPIVSTFSYPVHFLGGQQTRRRRNLMNLERLLERIAILDFDMAAAEEYGHIKAELKAKGRPIPGTDAQIAAAARLHGLTVLSADRHFQYVDNLRVENWLTELSFRQTFTNF